MAYFDEKREKIILNESERETFGEIKKGFQNKKTLFPNILKPINQPEKYKFNN